MKSTIIMSLFTMLLGIFSCQAQNKGYESVSADDFEHIIADTNVIRLDVRTNPEYNDGHIENAINIDVLQDDFEKKAIATLNKAQTIAVYCRSGRRSKSAAQILVKKGYKIVELDTGYLGWKSAGKKIAN